MCVERCVERQDGSGGGELNLFLLWNDVDFVACSVPIPTGRKNPDSLLSYHFNLFVAIGIVGKVCHTNQVWCLIGPGNSTRGQTAVFQHGAG